MNQSIVTTRLQTCLRWPGLPFGIAVHFGKNTAEYRYVAPPNENQSVESLNLWDKK